MEGAKVEAGAGGGGAEMIKEKANRVRVEAGGGLEKRPLEDAEECPLPVDLLPVCHV